MRTDLAAAIAEIKESYEHESAGLGDPVSPLECESDSSRQRADDQLERDATQIEVEGAKARAARAVAALASEHETRLAAEVELDQLRAEVEGERERTRVASQQAQVAGERWQRAEAEVIELHREIEERHHQAEKVFAQLVEEANGLEQRLQAAEVEAMQFRQAEAARGVFGRWPRLSATASALLGVVIAVGVMSTWLLYTSPEPAPQPSRQILGGAPTVRPPEPASVSAEQGRGDSSQLRPQLSGPQQQSIPAAPMQSKVPEGKFATSISVTADALPPPGEQTEPAQVNIPAYVGPQQPEPPPTAHISIHYRQGSPSARADAERVATWIASSSFGGSRLLRTNRAPKEQVVRYFFVEDAEAASRIVEELQKRGGSWRAEDRTHDRHKPPAGNIEVWPTQTQ
jgi:hypothetical protein